MVTKSHIGKEVRPREDEVGVGDVDDVGGEDVGGGLTLMASGGSPVLFSVT